MKEDQICGTTNPTPHQVLLDTRFELPFGMMTLSHAEADAAVGTQTDAGLNHVS